MADFDDALCADEIGSFHFINVSNVANIASAPGIPDVSDGQLRSEHLNDMVDELRLAESQPDRDEFCQELGKSCQDDSNLPEDIIGDTVDCPEESDVDHHDVDEDHAVEENHVLDQSNDVAGAIEENPDLLDQSETVVSDPEESNAVPVQSEGVVAVSAAVPVVTNMEEYVALAKKFRCRPNADIDADNDMDKEWKYNGESEFRKIAADFINRTKQELADSRARLRARTPMSARVAAVLDNAEQRRNEMIQASSKIREQKLAAVMAQCAGYVEPVDLQESDSDTDDVGTIDDSDDVSDPDVDVLPDVLPDVVNDEANTDVLPDVGDSVDVLPDVDDEAVSDVDDEANTDDDVNADDHSNDDQDFDGSDTNTAESHENLTNPEADVENNNETDDPDINDFNDAVETTADAIPHQIIAADN